MNCAGCSHLKFPMPPNPNSLKSALSRQMQRLRQQVDRIDLKVLQLLQQRTKLSGQIGQAKRRHGAVIYVPERERELVARLARLGKGQPSKRALVVLYLDGFSYSEIADVVGISDSNVGVRLNRIKKELAATVQEVKDE